MASTVSISNTNFVPVISSVIVIGAVVIVILIVAIILGIYLRHRHRQDKRTYIMYVCEISSVADVKVWLCCSFSFLCIIKLLANTLRLIQV